VVHGFGRHRSLLYKQVGVVFAAASESRFRKLLVSVHLMTPLFTLIVQLLLLVQILVRVVGKTVVSILVSISISIRQAGFLAVHSEF